MDIDVIYELDGGELNSNNLLAGDTTSTRDITYALVGEAGARILLNISATDYKMTAILQDKDGNTISTSNVIDLPLESMVVNGRYDSSTKKLILTLQNGNTISFSIADLISGLQTEITSTNKLSSDLVDDSTSVHKFVTTGEKENWNNKLEESDLSDYVKNTDYATSSTGGTFKFNGNTYATGVNSNGILFAQEKTYEQYQNALGGSAFIGKTTLENVITGKELVNKTYVDGLVGDIEEALQNI